ncbi:MAG TPA: hypothetical protein VF974_02695 [Patescibacteria group bacterium]
MISNINIASASEQYRKSVRICRDVFAATNRTFQEPKGVTELIRKARELYADNNEAAAVKEVEHADRWLNGIARKVLLGGIEHFEGRIKELSFMSLDSDIMERMEAQLKDFCVAITLEEESTSYELRVEAYKELGATVNGARAEQFARNEERERRAHEQVQRQEEERRQRRLEQERMRAEQEAAARATREKQFDQLFG